MTDFIWTKEMTEYVVNNVKSVSYAFSKPIDQLRTIEYIHNNKEEVTLTNIRNLIKLESTQDILEFLTNINILIKDDNFYRLTTDINTHSLSGFYAGSQISDIINYEGIKSKIALNMLGHNFLLNIKESLELCSQLHKPGLQNKYLKDILVNRYVFNQKLNPVKYDIVLKYLIDIEVIKEGQFGYYVEYSPSILTFYIICKNYFFLSNYKIGENVDARTLLRLVDETIPYRNEDHKILGFEHNPVEGWGKRQASISKESFVQFLKIGLIDPKSIVTMLKNYMDSNEEEYRNIIKETSIKLKKQILEDTKRDHPEAIGVQDIIQILDKIKDLR